MRSHRFTKAEQTHLADTNHFLFYFSRTFFALEVIMRQRANIEMNRRKKIQPLSDRSLHIRQYNQASNQAQPSSGKEQKTKATTKLFHETSSVQPILYCRRTHLLAYFQLLPSIKTLKAMIVDSPISELRKDPFVPSISY
jgi:hypothetical protein